MKLAIEEGVTDGEYQGEFLDLELTKYRKNPVLNIQVKITEGKHKDTVLRTMVDPSQKHQIKNWFEAIAGEPLSGSIDTDDYVGVPVRVVVETTENGFAKIIDLLPAA